MSNFYVLVLVKGSSILAVSAFIFMLFTFSMGVFSHVFIFMHTCSHYMKKNLMNCILICHGKITLREMHENKRSKILLLSKETSTHLSVHLQIQQTLGIVREMNKLQKIAMFVIRG